MATPWLPITPAEARRLAGAVRARAGDPRSARRFPERVALSLVRTFRTEGRESDDPKELCRHAVGRARRAGALGGFGGITTRSVGEAAELLERARLVVALSDALAPGRPEDEVAADLLVIFGTVPDRDDALGAIRDQGPGVLEHAQGRAIARMPEHWTVGSTLVFLWRTYSDVGAARELIQPRRLIPGVGAVTGWLDSGRDMKALCKATEKLVAA